jgi:malate dehydrogenase (oxaloacetate-decarboxylating)(NADP+)
MLSILEYIYSAAPLPDFARTDYEGPPLTELTDIVRHVKPTALLGLSTIRVRVNQAHLFADADARIYQNAFTEDVVKLMSSINARPIIFPLSNPISLSEVDFADAISWLDSFSPSWFTT